MNHDRFRSFAIFIILIFMSGCVGYVSPYPQYSPVAVPYAVPPPAYSYRIYPVVPLPLFYFGWRYGGHGYHGHYRHH